MQKLLAGYSKQQRLQSLQRWASCSGQYGAENG